MQGYLSIGKVAKLKNVSIKSLRYYDEIGILKPAYINEQTNYRYYKEEQLMMIDAITLCIELGIPLKEFEKYRDKSGNLQLETLLFDGKILAEKKIKAMSHRLETLQYALTLLEQKREQAPPYQIKSLPERTLLLIPFDDSKAPNTHNAKLLELLVTAQKAGLKSCYPSGILYDCFNGSYKKFLFIHIVENLSAATFDSSLLGSCMLKQLPEQDYACYGSNVSSLRQAEQIFKELLAKKEQYTFLEIKNIEKKGEEKSSPFELQLLL